MVKVSLADTEKIILRGQSCFSLTGESWKPGFLCLTNERLFFSPPNGRIVFQVYLENLIEIKPVIGKFILGLRRRLLNIVYRSRKKERLLQAYFAVNNLEQWEKTIKEAKAEARRQIDVQKRTVEDVLKDLEKKG